MLGTANEQSIKLQCVLRSTYTYTHQKWKNVHLVAQQSSWEFREVSYFSSEHLYTYTNDTLSLVTEGLVSTKLKFVV